MIVVLLGYMGVGKTSVGKSLAAILDQKFVDLDSYITQKEQVEITELFRTKGEIYFRSLESKSLREIIQTKDDIVLALGGGTPCYADNMELLKNTKKVHTFYLKLSIFNLVERLFDKKKERPLIAHIQNKEQLTEYIGKHLFERSNYYSQADHVIDCNQKSIEEIALSISKLLV